MECEVFLEYTNMGEGIHLHRNAVAHNGPKVIFTAANVHKQARKSIAHNGLTSFNVYR